MVIPPHSIDQILYLLRDEKDQICSTAFTISSLARSVQTSMLR